MCGTCPHACAFDIDPDEVHLRVKLCQPHGVFALATSQFENDGVLVVEIVFVPSALHREGFLVDDGVGVLEHILVLLHVGELRQFSFAHSVYVVLFAKVMKICESRKQGVQYFFRNRLSVRFVVRKTHLLELQDVDLHEENRVKKAKNIN